MNAQVLTAIKDLLMDQPWIDLKESESRITISPNGGYPVWLEENNGVYTVGYDIFSGEANGLEDALKSIRAALTGVVRIEVTSRNGKPVKTAAQFIYQGKWMDVNVVKRKTWLTAFWEAAEVTHKQNALQIS